MCPPGCHVIVGTHSQTAANCGLAVLLWLSGCQSPDALRQHRCPVSCQSAGLVLPCLRALQGRPAKQASRRSHCCATVNYAERKFADQAHVSSCNAGQSNDGIFKFARAGRVTCKVDRIKEVRERSLVLFTGEEVPADLIVFAYGLKYQAEPECLKELGIGECSLLFALATLPSQPSAAVAFYPQAAEQNVLGSAATAITRCVSLTVQTQLLLSTGFKDLHSFAFLGPSGRIGTAQDGIFAYVPAGPHKQFDMFLHSYQCYKRGLLQVLFHCSHVHYHQHLIYHACVCHTTLIQ